jgi:biopolymer transport protein ExbB
MKKLFAVLALIFCIAFVSNVATYAQQPEEKKEEKKEEAKEEKKEEPKAEEDTKVSDSGEEVKVADQTTHQYIKQQFIDGGWEFMTPIIACLIIGLAIALERVITLNLASTNTKKLTAKIEEALNSGGVEAAKEVAVNTRGPIASIFAQGLMRMGEGVDMVEKSIVAYGSVEMSKLEKGLVWISLFIALAPMLGFFGTVVGMIFAFDDIAKAGDISPNIVASGIKVALLTTVAGLIVAMILQVFYNYISSKVDSIVTKMEDASITLVDMLVAYERKGK